MARPLHLEAGPLRASIAPDLGGAVLDFTRCVGGREPLALLRRTPPWARSGFDTAMFLLAPWSNRIEAGRLSWRGRDLDLGVNFGDGTAIHGQLFDRPLRIVERTPCSVLLSFDSGSVDDAPWVDRYGAVARYEVSPDALACEISVTNLGDHAMPAGGGFHPYFPRFVGGSAAAARVRVPVTARYPAEGCLPTGDPEDGRVCGLLRRGASLGELDSIGPLDDIFVGGRDAEIAYADAGLRLVLETSASLGHWVVFTPRENDGGVQGFFCVEPVSHVTNGFNLMQRGWEETGTRVLEPGESLEMSLTIRVDSI